MNRRRQRSRRAQQPTSTLTSIGTNALIAYGTYKAVCWAWKTWYKSDDTDKNEEVEEGQEHLPQQQQQQQPRHLLEDIATSTISELLLTQPPTSISSTSPPFTPSSSYPSSFSTNYYSTQGIDNNANTRAQRKKCRAETWSTFTSLLLPMLQTKLEEGTKLSSLTKALKKLRKRRKTLEETEPTTTNGSVSLSAQKKHREQQRKRNKEEADIWKKIQLKTITRMVSTVYAHNFLFLVLWVQVHVLGGRLHRLRPPKCQSPPPQDRGAQNNDSGEDTSSPPPPDEFESHRTVLTQTFQVFFTDGLSRLIREVEAIVEVELKNWNVIVDDDREDTDADRTPMETTTLGCISGEDLEEAIYRIRSSLDTDVVNGPTDAFVSGPDDDDDKNGADSCSFVVSLFATDTTDTKNDTIIHILNETWDLMESPIWKEVESECMDVSFNIFRDGSNPVARSKVSTDERVGNTKGGWNELFTSKSHPDSSTWSGNKDDESLSADGRVETVPLAYILTQLKKITQNSFYTQVDAALCPNAHVWDIDNLSSLNELGDVSFNSYY